MNKEFVKYKNALALGELGFDERCFGHYNLNGVFFWKILCSDEDNDHTLSIKDIMEHVADGYIEAPLYQQAFRWLMEKYHVYGTIHIINVSEVQGALCEVELVGPPKNKLSKVYKLVGPFNYQEAQDACLDKLIELVKNDNTTK